MYNIKSKEIYASIKKIYKLKSDNISEEESDNNKEINKNIFPSFDTIKIQFIDTYQKNYQKILINYQNYLMIVNIM